MAETAAQKKAREEKAAALREEIEAEMRAKLEAEYAEKLAAEKAAIEASATNVHAQATPPDVQPDPETAESITVHFVDDGFTALGKIWYRGEEITATPGTDNWKNLLDNGTGRCVLSYSEAEQIRVYGRRMFAPGPWPHGGFDLDDPNLTEQERETLRKINERRQAQHA